MAEVFLAMQRGRSGVRKLTVIKRLRAGMGNDPHFERLFLNEARLAARLNHPNVVQTFEVGVDGSVHFIAMEYLAGQPLNKVLSHAAKHPDAFPLAVRLQLVSDCLAGLDYAHALPDFDGRPLGIVHRDISPHNVFVTYDGVTKVVDFGIAKTTEAPQFAEMSTAGGLKGKIRYKAPEQLRGEGITTATDVYALGVVLRELCGPDVGLPPDLRNIIAVATRTEPERRYPDARSLAEDLERLLQDQPVQATPEAVWLATGHDGDRAAESTQ